MANVLKTCFQTYSIGITCCIQILLFYSSADESERKIEIKIVYFDVR